MTRSLIVPASNLVALQAMLELLRLLLPWRLYKDPECRITNCLWIFDVFIVHGAITECDDAPN